MKRLLPALLLGAVACSKKQPAPAPVRLNDFAKEVLLTLNDLKVQPGAAACMNDLDADPELQAALVGGLDSQSKTRFQELVNKHGKSAVFREAVVAAGGDPTTCGAPKPGDTDPGCEAETAAKSPDLLSGPPPKKNAKNLLDP